MTQSSPGSPYASWSAVRQAPRSPFFSAGKADAATDRARQLRGGQMLLSDEALFTQSNARVLLGHAANGMLRFAALPTQLYPAPTGTGEFGLGPGMYHHFDVAMAVPDLCYRIEPEGGAPIVISSSRAPEEGLDVTTAYSDDFLPLTTAQAGALELTLLSFAPVAAQPAALAPAPLPGPAAALYVLVARNTGAAPLRGKLILRAEDLLVGHYEDAAQPAALRAPQVSLRQTTLILSRPCGAVGIHLHGGRWTKLEAPFEAEIALDLAPGAEQAFETHVALGAAYAEVMPTIYALHMRDALAWLNLTAAYWRGRLGALSVGASGLSDPELLFREAQVSRDIYVRSLFDNFNCLQTDAQGTLLAHWQGAPSHGYGTVWGIDVEPTAVSVAHLVPEIAWATLRFFMTRSRVPKGPADHSVPILVAPIVIARQALQITGDVERFRAQPEVLAALRGIVSDLLALQAPGETLFPSRFSSDGAVGRRYDYGTNVKVWYAFDSMAYLAEQLGEVQAAAGYRAVAAAIREAIDRTMVGEGPFGPQITGGTNLGEDPGSFYLPEGVPYYDGEDTSSMLAPVYGMSDFADPRWIAYHRFARSLWCPNFDPEFGALRWSPRGFAGGALDGTGYFSRLGGSVTPQEMAEALRTLWRVGTDEATGSVFWWPHGMEFRRALTRCSQGQGAWAWQYLKQWLGIEVDAPTRTLTLAPRGLLTEARWEGFCAGPHRFDIAWSEQEGALAARIVNLDAEPWTARIGARPPGSGALGAPVWHTVDVAPGVERSLTLPAPAPLATLDEMSEAAMLTLETAREGAAGILIRRFGPEQLWGHWDMEKLWDVAAMPLVIRLLIANGTETPWDAVDVELRCPAGWSAQGRAPRAWPRADALRPEAALALGPLPAQSRAVAPFWVRWPADLALDLLWHEGPQLAFHTPTQPGPGLTLYARIDAPAEVVFEAVVSIRPAGGAPIQRALRVPVRLLPRP